jgi:hypothetical protein
MDFFNRVVDQLNPLSDGNVVLYFITVFVYVYTFVAVWLARHAAWRLFCLVFNQIFSFGVFSSWATAMVITYTFWRYALAMAVFALLCALVPVMLRRRRERPVWPR